LKINQEKDGNSSINGGFHGIWDILYRNVTFPMAMSTGGHLGGARNEVPAILGFDLEVQVK
jgi:hypothetical protein